MMTDDLRKLAEANESSEPWRYGLHKGGGYQIVYKDGGVAVCYNIDDAKFIAAANPQAIRMLYSERDRLVELLETVLAFRQLDDYRPGGTPMSVRIRAALKDLGK